MSQDVETSEADFIALLDYLRQSRGFDFHSYKRASLARRIGRRMQTVGVSGYADYCDFLQVHPEEVAQLFDSILINVTGFFRDAQAWEVMQREVVPRIASRKLESDTIRVWSAGCATGEEAYTLAMVFAEALGEDRFMSQVKIYATDVDENSLSFARRATFSERSLADVPAEMLPRYFEEVDGQKVFRKDLRRQIIFGRHDLILDAPISRVDLLSCRNAIMYLNSETQSRILSRFHFALNEGGILFLGRAETIFAHAKLFAPVDLKHRVFSKIPGNHARDRVALLPENSAEPQPSLQDCDTRLAEAAFDANETAQVVVDINGTILLANKQARVLFGIVPRDIGRQLQDLEFSYRPLELRSLIDRTYGERRPIQVKETSWPTAAGEPRWMDVSVTPLSDESGGLLGASVLFKDVTRYRKLQSDLEFINQELESAYEELQSTNEELETTNEELQSTVEELETTNEELQSTNEELETMNEELQSTNEELQTLNDEMRIRTERLNNSNAFLEAITTSLRGGVLVVDRDLHVLIWNMRMEDLWGLRKSEAIGKNVMALDIGLPFEPLSPHIRAVLADGGSSGETVVDATNRRGKAIQCAVSYTPLLGSDGDVQGVILLMNELNDGFVGDAEKAVRTAVRIGQ